MDRVIKLSISLLLLSVLISLNTFVKADGVEMLKHNVILTFNERILFHEKIADGKSLQIFNDQRDIIEHTQIVEDYEAALIEPTAPHHFIFSYWEMIEKENTIDVTPIFTERKAFQAGFIGGTGGTLIHNSSAIKEVVKSFDEEASFQAVAPDVLPNDNYVFKGWYYYKDSETLERLDITSTTKPQNRTEYFALFYEDTNQNNIDDAMENDMPVGLLPQPETITQPSNNNSNEVLTYTNTKYVFNNTNVNSSFLVKFLATDNTFLYSLTLPYGRSITMLDQTNKAVKEYFVRQETTIMLNLEDYVFNEAEFLKFESHNRKINNTEITEVFPIIQQPEIQSLLAVNESVDNAKANNASSNAGNIIVLTVVILLAIAAAAYFIIRRKRQANEHNAIN